MTLDELLASPCAWFVDHDPGEIAISSRIRLARNLEGYPFPGRAKPAQRAELRARVLEVLEAEPHFAGGLRVCMEEVGEQAARMLFERSLISKEHAEDAAEGGVAVSPDSQDVILINEEDHLRMQVIRPGLSLEAAWDEMKEVDDAIEAVLPCAYSGKYGYLTCCPTNTGTGMRAGVMLHLPGLALLDEMGPVMRSMAKMGLAVRGVGGEGSEADGYLYQVSNQMTLGPDEETLLAGIRDVAEELIVHERNARLRLAKTRPAWLRDRVGRAAGILSSSWVLPSKEALDLLGLVRLGLAMELLALDRPHGVEQLMIEVRPAHLQRLAGGELEPEARDVFRAQWVRSRLADLRKGGKLDLS